MKKICMTGGRGKIGSYLSKLGAIDLECDVTNTLEIQRSIKYYKPDIIVHLASKSDVNWCEKRENEQKVIDVNFSAVSKVCSEAEKVGCQVVLISSDHVFPGGFWSGKYKEDDNRKPLNFYGTTKVAAEGLTSIYSNLKIVRTSYLFDESRLRWDLDGMKKGYIAEFPTFIRRTFMYLPHFALSMMNYLQRLDDMPEILHISGSNSVSWYEFMLDLAKAYGHHESLVLPRKKDLQNGFAPRGKNLGLNTSLAMRLGFHKYSYLDGLQAMVNDE